MTIETVQAELKRISDSAKGNLEAVSAEVKSLKAQNADLIQKHEGLASMFREFEQATLTTATGGQLRTARAKKSLAEQFSGSDSFKAFLGRETKSASFATDRTLKALVNEGAADSNATEYPTQAQRDPNLANDPRRRLSLLEALPTRPMVSATFEWVSLDGYSNAAAEQGLEGEEKAEAGLPNELKTVRAATVAHFLPASEQVLQDTPGLAMQIESLLRYGVQAKAEALIVGGTGNIQGLETVGTAFPGETGEDMATAISRAEAHLAAIGWSGTHCIMHPQDWHAMRTQKRGSSDDSFVVGSWMNPPTLNAWGLEIVTSPSVTLGTAIVLDASQVAILDRMSAVVEAFREDGSNVRENMVTLRSEARMAFAVFAPSAVQLVTVT